MPDDTKGTPPFIVAASTFTPKTLEMVLMSCSSVSG